MFFRTQGGMVKSDCIEQFNLERDVISAASNKDLWTLEAITTSGRELVIATGTKKEMTARMEELIRVINESN